MSKDEQAQESSYPLSQLLRDISVNKDFGDPFNDNFDLDLIEKEIEDFEKDNKVEYDSEGHQTLESFILLNQMNESLMLQIETEIIDSGLSESQLTEGVFLYANASFLNVYDLTNDLMQKRISESDTVGDMTIPPSPMLKTPDGENVSVQGAIDNNVDIAIEILDLIYSFKDDLRSKKKDYTEDILDQIHRMFLITGQLINLREAFKSFQFEFVGLKITKGKKISFFNKHPTYIFLKEAGGKRSTKLVQEFLLRTGQMSQSIDVNIPITTINKGYLRIRPATKKTKDFLVRLAMGQLNVFYGYLHKVKFKRLRNFRLEDMALFLVALRGIFDSSQESIDIKKTENSNAFQVVPFRITKKDLVGYIKKKTGFSHEIVVELLNTLTTTTENETNLWKTPFLSVGQDLYYILPAVSGAHFEYLLDRLILAQVPENIRIQFFKKYVQERLNDLSNDYLFNSLSSEEVVGLLGEEAEDVLIYVLKSKVIIFQVCLYGYPIESNEYHEILYEFWSTSQRLNTYSKKISDKAHDIDKLRDKEILKIGVTNYVSLSGFEIEGCYFLDPSLVSNYFDAGELKRARINLSEGDHQDDILSAFKYYRNEDEFNENIKAFCLNPEPVVEIASRIYTKDFRITYPGAPIEVTEQGIQFDELGQTIDHQINEIEYYFKQLYYFEKDLKQTPETISLIERKLEYLIPITLNYLAISKKDREHRVFLLAKFKKVKLTGLGYLVFSLQKELSILSQKNIIEDPPKPELAKEIDVEKIIDEAIKQAFDQDGRMLGLSSAKIGGALSKLELDSVIANLYDQLGALRMRHYSEDELEALLIHTTILAGFIRENEEYHHLLYTAFLNYIDVLNFNYQYQKARDVCEEILEFSFKNETNPTIGWLCQFKCHLKQQNLYDAAYYCALFVSSIASNTTIPKYRLQAALYNSFLFFRDAKIEEQAEMIYEILKATGGDEYEEQKLTLSYFNMKLWSLYQGSTDFIDDILGYLNEKKDSIIKYGQEGVLPWIGLLFNIKNGFEHQKIELPTEIESYIKELRQTLDSETFKEFESMFFPTERETKKTLQKALTGAFESRYFEDFASELQNLRLLAKNALVLSLNPVDINGLLLSGIALNDNFLTFDEEEQDGQIPFKSGKHNEISSRLSNYSENILHRIKLEKNQILLWVFESKDAVYTLSIHPDKSYQLTELKDWELTQMNDWMSGINDLVFADKADYSINLQEQEYLNQLSKLSFTQLVIDFEFNDVLIYFDLNLSRLPHNLIQIQLLESDSIQHKHELLVKEKIETTRSDFIGLYRSITNVFTLEWFAENGGSINLPKSTFSISGWSPLEDEDFTLLSSASKLEPIIDEVGGSFIRDLLPKDPLASDLNFFLAHGDKGIEGFRSVYSREDDNAHAFVRGSGIKRIFGSGTIAVLFICNSASISPEIHSQRLVSFINEIMALGYKSVIAPAWKLNSDIAAVWMKPFLDHLMSGESISNCVSHANRSIAFAGYNDYNGFYDPSGWAAMHLYGNPNICIDPDA